MRRWAITVLVAVAAFAAGFALSSANDNGGRRAEEAEDEAAPVDDPVTVTSYRSLRDRQLRLGIESVTAVSERTSEVLEEHASIVRAVKRGLAPSIQRVARAHLDGTRRSLRLLPAQ